MDDVIRISEKESFEKILAEYSSHPEDLESQKYQIDLESPPKIKIVVEGDQYSSSLTAPLMESLIQVQRDFRRAYKIVKYGNPTKRLSLDEKRATEIKFQIEKGSTGAEVYLAWVDLLNSLGLLEAVKNLSGEQLITVMSILSGTFLLGKGIGVVKDIVTRKVEKSERVELKSKDVEAQMVQQQNLLEAVKIGQGSQQRFIKKAKGPAEITNISIGDETFEEENIKEIQDYRQPKEEKVISVVKGDFFVKAVYFGDNDTLMDVLNEATQEKIPRVYLQDATLSEKDFQIIEMAKNRYSVRLQIVIEKRRDDIIKATLDSVLQDDDIDDADNVE